jgi:hypothetical protein
MHVLFITLVGPVLFFLLTWVVATAYRLYFPEKPIAFDRDPVVLQEQRLRQEQSTPVGVREIREDQRRSQYLGESSPDYQYVWGYSDGFPEAWRNDVRMRRN